MCVCVYRYLRERASVLASASPTKEKEENQSGKKSPNEGRKKEGRRVKRERRVRGKSEFALK